ncbi:MAG TPA: hypothetical protein VG603_02175, partial [Chitinophagales bacterium]|nr:hypothetical protein [Chitinophagales bacterium]
MATYSTGRLKGGWYVSASFARRWAKEGYVAGTFYDGYSYFLSVDKKFGENNTLSFTTYGTPTRYGQAKATVQEAYDLAGTNYYNPAWGYQNGVKRNASVINTFQPQFILNDDWKINDKSKFMASAGFSFGKRKSSALDWNEAADPLPDYYKNMPSYIGDTLLRAFAEQKWREDVNHRQIDWDNLYEINRNSYDTIQNANGIQGNDMRINRSRYILSNRVKDQKRFNFNATYNTEFNKHIGLDAGLYYQLEIEENYREIADLLGGKYYLDVDQYAQYTYPGSFDASQNNLLAPNKLLTTGDKYGYDYKTNVHHGGLWVQPQFTFGKVNFFAAAQLMFTSFWRDGLFKNGLFPDSSLGKSAVQNFINYSFKAGVDYKIDGRNDIYANGAYYTAAPYVNDVFLSPETRNQVVSGVKSSQVYSAEAGYKYIGPVVKLRTTFFFTQDNNQTQTRSFYDDNLYTYVNYTLTGVNTRHMGAEAAIEAKLYRGFSASAVASIGRYIYTARPLATITENNLATTLATNETVYLKNFNVAGSPQMAYSFGLSYRSPQFWYVNLNFNYYDWMWVEASPARRTVEGVAPLEANSAQWNSIIDQERLKGQFTMDFFAGYSWLL